MIPSLSTGFQPSIFEKLFLASNWDNMSSKMYVCLLYIFQGLEDTSIKQIVTMMSWHRLSFQHCASHQQVR